ncbi:MULTISPECIES: hypothetical protein [Paenibacillus]|uniref:Uncharacterized protein n=1 Tax=Paenibacillus campinasensis TaxID=66347 RepID=A0A268EDI9_9BACL|nr:MULTISPECIES: hypothetical protein [Paenibacillus]MUG68740.1 hypothetical protein [Paenibacillus campinasensis]PAD71196.1 hypothetical protein CHH67_25425 [Paenibacillus campinasensis]PAK47789.1 hypothetical protein CHH75_23970 [Paenibacillus sp. 7541]
MNSELNVNQETLVSAWQERLGTILKPGDRAEVAADEGNPQAVRIHIDTAGRQDYSFDFQCTYVDSREVRVDLVDVERAGATTDERNENIQGMVSDYTRHIHECAQALQQITHH